MCRFVVRKVAVLGAGVMGAQIAAHLVNVKVPVVLFDLAAKEGPKNGIVVKAPAKHLRLGISDPDDEWVVASAVAGGADVDRRRNTLLTRASSSRGSYGLAM